jgi:hypothetical protein
MSTALYESRMQFLHDSANIKVKPGTMLYHHAER